MSIVLHPFSSDTPSALTDWAAYLSTQQAIFMQIENPFRVQGSIVPKGAMFFVAGALYKATSDTNITGTASEYVKFTVSGSEIVPSFVTSLSGVTWNTVWNGYYDVNLNLHIFDELKAYKNSVISFPASVRNFKPVSKQLLDLLYVGFYNEHWYNLLKSTDPRPNQKVLTFYSMDDYGAGVKSKTKEKQFLGTSTSFVTVAEFDFFCATGFTATIENFYYEMSGFVSGLSQIRIKNGATVLYQGQNASGVIDLSPDWTLNSTKKRITVEVSYLASSPSPHTIITKMQFGTTSADKSVTEAATLFLLGDMIN